MVTGNGIDLESTQGYYGSYAGSFTLTIGMDVNDEDTWYFYNSELMVSVCDLFNVYLFVVLIYLLYISVKV